MTTERGAEEVTLRSVRSGDRFQWVGLPDQYANDAGWCEMSEVVGYHSPTYGLHGHPWEREPEANFVPTALRATLPKHVGCRPLTWADQVQSADDGAPTVAEDVPVLPDRDTP